MTRRRVKCVDTSKENPTHEDITHLGGDGWRQTRDQVIEAIDSGDTYFAEDAQGEAEVKVVRPVGRSAYLRTYRDGRPTDNLLQLSACPV